MFYVIEFGWGKKTNGLYNTQCRAGVELIGENKYRIYGVNYHIRPGKKWVMNPNTVWGPPDPAGSITGILKKNKKIQIKHRSLASIVQATIISFAPVIPPGKFTSPLAR
jgi:hypothetical protein